MTYISKRQFILSPLKFSIENMKEHIINKNYLYIDDKCNISECITLDGKKVFLLGNAFCTNVEGKRAEEDIASFSGENIEEITRFWTGRYVLITEKEVITDAASLMSAFYMQSEDKWLVSSSLALISKASGTSCDGEVCENGISHIILPETLNKNVKKLVTGYKIVFDALELKIQPISCFTDKTDMTTEEKCKAIAEILCTGLKNIHSFSNRQIVLALTGGKDSRLTFSALLKSGVPFSCYTAEHKNISSSDKSIPKKLCEKYGIPYTYIKSKTIDKERLSDYREFTAGNSKGADEEFYARGQFNEVPENSVIIRSGIFEAGQTYARSYTSDDIDGFVKTMTSYYSSSFSKKQRTAFEKWIDLIKENPIPFVDVRDRYYIEQRVGGWASAIEQSLDMNDFVSIQIANCAELISILLSASNEERKNLALTYETIKYLFPEALEIDTNKRTVFDKLRIVVNAFSNPEKIIKKFSKLFKRR